MIRKISTTNFTRREPSLLVLLITSSVLILNCSKTESGKQNSDTRANQPKQISLDTKGEVNALAFSPDGKLLAGTRENGSITIWNAQTGASLRSIQEQNVSSLKSVVFSPNGDMLAAGEIPIIGGGELWFWDTQTWQMKQGTGLWTDLFPRSVAFSPDSKLAVTGGRDGRVSFWDVASLKRTKAVKAVGGVVSFVAFLPDGVLLASGTSGKGVMKPRPDNPAWSTLQEFGEVALLDFATGKVRQSFATNDNETTDYRVAFSQDGKLFATRGAEDTIEIRDGQSGKVSKSLKGHKGKVAAIAISPDGKTLASAGDDKVIMLWNIETGAIDSTLTGHEGPVTFLLFSPDGKTLVSTSTDKSVRVWQLK